MSNRRIARGHVAAVFATSAAAVLVFSQCSNGNNAGPPASGDNGADASTCAPGATGTSTSPSPTGTAPPAPTATATADAAAPDGGIAPADPVKVAAAALIDEGRNTFRYETFGDEDFWGGALKLHEAIEGSTHDGGVGGGVSPKTALSVGLKVDVDALPAAVVAALKAGTVDLDSPDTTLTLLQANAVVGVTGVFDAAKNLTSLGVQCALCHSTVDDSLTKGIGHRLDGWANRDLNIGAIVNLSPDLLRPAPRRRDEVPDRGGRGLGPHDEPR